MFFCNNNEKQFLIKQDKRIKKAYEIAKKYLSKAHIIQCPLLLGNSAHKWGRAGLHFVDEIYCYLLDSVKLIITDKLSLAAEQSALQSNLIKYDRIIYDKISLSTNKMHTAMIDNRNKASRLSVYEQNFFKMIVNDNNYKKANEFFIKKNIKNISLYGYCESTRLLLKLLPCGIRVDYIIEDKKWWKEDIKQIKRNGEPFNKVDAIIICDMPSNAQIREKLNKLSIEMPFYDMYEIFDL